jgi:hypothetical protein
VGGADQLLDLRRHLGVEPRGGLVVHDDHRVHHDGPRNGHPLGHAAGELLAVAVHHGIGVEADVGERLAGKREDVRVGHPLDLARQDREVVEDVAGDERVALEHDGPVGPDPVEARVVQCGHVHQRGRTGGIKGRFMVGHEHLARIGREVRHDELQEHGLAAPGAADNRHHLAGPDGEVDPLENGLAAEGLAQPLGHDLTRRGGRHAARVLRA